MQLERLNYKSAGAVRNRPVMAFAVTAFNEITSRRMVVSRHATERAANAAARKYLRSLDKALPEIRVEAL